MVYRTNVDAGILKLFDQLDAACPGRNRSADGTIGDAAHSARESDHNPEYPAPAGNPPGQVDAGDYTNDTDYGITHDPRNGADMAAVSEAIRVSRDRRVSYLIFNRRITGPGHSWRWDTYTGTDPHTGHMHLSVNDLHHDETQHWAIGIGDTMTPAEYLAILKDPAVAAQMRALPWQYVGGGIPAGMSTLRVLNDTYENAKEAAAQANANGAVLTSLAGALPPDLAGKLSAILAAALDDGDVTVTLPPDAIAQLTELRDAIAAMPSAVQIADAVNDDAAARLAG